MFSHPCFETFRNAHSFSACFSALNRSHCRMTKIACLDRPYHLSQGLVCPGACHRLANPARRNRCRRTKCKWCWASFWTYLIWLDVTRCDSIWLDLTPWCCLILVIIGQYYLTNWTHKLYVIVDATEEKKVSSVFVLGIWITAVVLGMDHTRHEASEWSSFWVGELSSFCSFCWISDSSLAQEALFFTAASSKYASNCTPWAAQKNCWTRKVHNSNLGFA